MHEILYFLMQELDLVPSNEVTLPIGSGLHTQDKITNKQANKNKQPLFLDSCTSLLQLS